MNERIGIIIFLFIMNPTNNNNKKNYNKIFLNIKDDNFYRFNDYLIRSDPNETNFI